MPLQAIESIAFASRARIGLSELTILVRWSRERNESLGVTGLLLFDSTYFFGYLEGEPSRVQRLYDAISADDRHEDVRLVDRSPLEQRRFPRWFMGYLYEPKFAGELEAQWRMTAPTGELGARLERWSLEGDVL